MGAKPGDLSVRAPSRYAFEINLGIAKAIGIEIPPKLSALADEVIGGMLGFGSEHNLGGTLAGLAAGVAAPAVGARAVMSGPVQNWLSRTISPETAEAPRNIKNAGIRNTIIALSGQERRKAEQQ